MLDVDVVPTVGTMQNGRLPARWSAATVSRNTSTRMRNASSTGILRMLSWPIPSVMPAFSTEECACSEVYITKPGALPRVRDSGSAISRAAAMACRVLMEAVS